MLLLLMALSAEFARFEYIFTDFLNRLVVAAAPVDAGVQCIFFAETYGTRF